MTAPRVDRNGLEVLSREECLRLLRRVPVGRVALTVEALPVVLPVNFALLGEDIVFRTGTGAKLAAALDRAVLAFEADDIDAVSHAGWSVLVRGMAHAVTDVRELEAVAGLPLSPWLPNDRGHVVRLRADIVTGRRLYPGGVIPDPLVLPEDDAFQVRG